MSYYTIPLPLGLGTTIEVFFDTEEVAAFVRLLDAHGDLILDYDFPHPVRAIADAYMKSWLFEADGCDGYVLADWCDPTMWQESIGERLGLLASEGFAIEGGEALAAA